MTRSFLALPVIVAALAACTPAEQNAALGAGAGALVGAAVSSDSDREKGAIVGAIAGVAASQLLGRHSEPGKCVYRDQYGNRFVADCP